MAWSIYYLIPQHFFSYENTKYIIFDNFYGSFFVLWPWWWRIHGRGDNAFWTPVHKCRDVRKNYQKGGFGVQWVCRVFTGQHFLSKGEFLLIVTSIATGSYTLIESDGIDYFELNYEKGSYLIQSCGNSLKNGCLFWMIGKFSMEAIFHVMVQVMVMNWSNKNIVWLYLKF